MTAVLALWSAATPPVVPSFAAVRAAWRPSDVRLLDRRGEILHEVRTDPRRRRLAWTPLGQVSPALVSAVIASEDRRFHEHDGVDVRALAVAAAGRLGRPGARGASTITMQVAALIDPGLRRAGGGRTLGQKWRQVRAAWALGARWSRAEVLEAYLNLVTFRGELEGVAAASQALFGRAPHGLDAAEAVVLAALLRAPNARTEALARRAVRLARVAGVDAGDVTVAVERVREPVAAPGDGIAPHVAARLLRGAGSTVDVRSTLDAGVQRVAVEALRRQLSAVHDQHVQDGAVLVVDNASGEVRAYVGSTGDLSSARWVDGVRARRQPGSTLKPFLYGLALDGRVLTASSLLVDGPLEVAVSGGLYRPHDYDDRFRGVVSVRTALASSLNVPAVRALGLVGEEAFAMTLRRLGFGGLVEPGDFYGPALALGSADVTLWELVSAYRALAAGGVWSPLRLMPDAARAGARRVYSAEAAFVVTHVLADRESRSATFGLENALATPFWTAVKTGTSQDMRDNWCVGFSRRYTVGVWVGNFSGEPMWNVSGVTGAAPVWLEVMTWLHRATPSEPPPAPPGVVAAEATFTRGIEPPRREWYLAGTEPRAAVGLAEGARPRIVAPTSSAILAIDPDIPATRQRVALEARHGRGLRFALDGQDLGDAGDLVLWAPRPGRHRLALVDPEGAILDLARFEVRGTGAAQAPAP